MKNKTSLALLAIFFSSVVQSQIPVPQLQKFSDLSLFNLKDSSCLNVSGDWTGEEIQYDPTGSFIKAKFKVFFHLKQEGNRVYGTSYIKDKFHDSYGDMKLRGIVIGNTLHFEEYELDREKFFEPGWEWCVAAGVMHVATTGTTITMTSPDYNTYGSKSYHTCIDHCEMYLAMPLQPALNTKQIGTTTGNVKTNIENTTVTERTDVIVFPNPCTDQGSISYELKEKAKVRIDIFNLSGALIEPVLDELQEAGKQTAIFNLSAYAPGVYLIRFISGNSYSTKQLIRSK